MREEEIKMSLPKIGDIILKRSFGFFGYFVRHLFPKTKLAWPSGRYPTQASSHNGLVGTIDGVLGVFEASYRQTLFFTPWEKYLRQIKLGKCEVKIARLPALSDADRDKLNEYLRRKLGRNIKYDYLGIFTLVINMLTQKSTFAFQSRSRWFCTEVICYGYRHINKDLFENNFPTPLYIEGLLIDKTLIEVGNLYLMS